MGLGCQVAKAEKTGGWNSGADRRFASNASLSLGHLSELVFFAAFDEALPANQDR